MKTCKFCHKTYQNKHTCKYMERVYNKETIKAYNCFKIFCEVFNISKNSPEDFIVSKFYNLIITLNRFFTSLDGNILIESKLKEYLKYLIDNRIYEYEWNKQSTFDNFISFQNKNENEALAIVRSENYLKDNGLNWNLLNSYQKKQLLMLGYVSPYYLNSSINKNNKKSLKHLL